MNDHVLDAFSNSIRLKLILCLAEERKSVNELVGKCRLSQSSVSQHLSKLKKAGVVATKKEGKYIYYSLIYPNTAKIALQIDELIFEIGRDLNKSSY